MAATVALPSAKRIVSLPYTAPVVLQLPSAKLIIAVS